MLKRNPKWWGATAKLEQVTYVQMEDQASINAFQNGEIDATGVGTADRLKQVSGMQHVQIGAASRLGPPSTRWAATASSPSRTTSRGARSSSGRIASCS